MPLQITKRRGITAVHKVVLVESQDPGTEGQFPLPALHLQELVAPALDRGMTQVFLI
jgi:hypothetical protein